MPKRPRVLFVGLKLTNTGGVPRISRSVVDALRTVADVKVVNVHPDGSIAGRVKGVCAVQRELLRRGWDLVVFGHPGPADAMVPWLPFGRRFVVIAHGIEIWGPRHRVADAVISRATEVWTFSDFVAGEVERAVPNARTRPCLGGGISPTFAADHVEVAGPFRVLLVCRIFNLEHKGVDVAIDAVASLADRYDVQLRIVGGGPAGDELAELVTARGRGVVEVLGRVSEEDLRDEYRKAGVVVLPSRFRRGSQPLGEGLGLVLLEGAAAGTPGIASSMGGSVGAVVDGETGFLVPAGEPGLLADRIAQLIADPSRRREMGEAARRFALGPNGAAAFRQNVVAALKRCLPDRL